MPKRLDLAKLVRVPYVWGYDVSPDGQTVAFTWDKPGHIEVYLARADGQGRPRRLTRGPESKWAPRWSPDGQRLAFAHDYGGDENYDLFVYDRRTRQIRNLTPDTPDEAINPEVSWSPDGRCLAYTTNRPGTFAAYVLAADEPGTPPRRLTHHAYSDFAAAWSPDGRHVAVTSMTHGQETWLFIVPAAGGEPTVVGGPDGPMNAHSARWSPDGQRLAFVSNTPGISAVYVYDLASGAVQQVTPNTHEADEPVWSPDGRRLAYTWNEDGNVGLRLTDLASGETFALGVGPGVHALPRFGPDGRTLYALFASAQRTMDLWAFSLSRSLRRPRKRQVTHSMPAGLAPSDFVMPKVVRWQNEGLTIAGLLYTPRGFRRGRTRAPAVLYVHGGPTWQYRNEWYIAVQHLVSEGCVVLAPNYRGSTGYGRAFQEANRFDLGGGDMRDVIAGAEFLVREGYAQPGRLAITGASYGGYLTMTALTRYPRVFAAGSAVVPFLNWFTEHANEREDLQHWDLENFGDPVKDAGRYREYSPYFYLENIVAPVQMIAGANDPRCPASETEQAAAVLKRLGVPHDIVIYPDEGHAFRKLANRLDYYRRRARFLLQHLSARP